MFDVKLERITENEEGVVYRLSWYAGGERQEKWIFKTWEELKDDDP